MTKIINLDNILSIKNHYKILTFGGFSFRDYDKSFDKAVTEILESYDPSDTYILAGASSTGIGKVYEIAKPMGFNTLGLVAANLAAKDVSQYCDQVCFIDTHDPNEWYLGTLMAEISDEMIYFGGGETSWKEIVDGLFCGKKIRLLWDYFPQMTPAERTKKMVVATNLLNLMNQRCK